MKSILSRACGVAYKKSPPNTRAFELSARSSFVWYIFSWCLWSVYSLRLEIVWFVVVGVFLTVQFSFSQHHLLKRLPLFHRIALLLCQRSVACIYRSPFLGSLFCSIDLYVYSSANALLSYRSFIVSPEIYSISPLTLVFSFILYWLFWVFCLSI